MARPLRIEYAGAVYHVTSRGDRREAIYLDDDDRCLLYTSPSPRDKRQSRMPSSA